MKTFIRDPTLPFLPVPDLQATCAALPALVAPLVNEPVLAATRAALEKFLRPGGAGELLQRALLDLQFSLPGNASWLRPFWDDMYTSLRAPLPENVNYFFRLADERWGENALPRFVRAVAAALVELGRGVLPPEKGRAGYLSMDQARSCVYTRIPAQGSDVLRLVPLTGPQSIALSCAGHWFVIPVVRDDGSVVSERFLMNAFAAVRKQVHTLPPAIPVSAFTAAERNKAASLRAGLLQSLANRLSLAAVERSLFTLHLAPAQSSADDFARCLFGRDASSRWFDKSLQIIAAENGGIGVAFEHAGCDATIWLHLLGRADVLTGAAAEEHPRSDETVDRKASSCRRLLWDIPPVLKEDLEAARQDFTARSDNVELVCREYGSLSKTRLKACNTSPDAFLQICFQAAQHAVFGTFRSSYEAVAMRNFFQGRTDCARGSSEDALAFSIALADNAPPEKLLELYKRAEQTHSGRLKRCQQGLGIERHMFGLQAMFRLYGKQLGLEEPPALFTDPGWLALHHDSLSTSSVAAPFVRLFGFGPTVPDGIGIGYTPGTERTGLVIASLKNGAHAAGPFAAAFERVSQSLQALLLQCGIPG